jgi:hypothetical protein
MVVFIGLRALKKRFFFVTIAKKGSLKIKFYSPSEKRSVNKMPPEVGKSK